MDQIFKALADKSRRHLLDALRDSDGQTLNQLCAQLDMSRQAVSKHLEILISADLVVPVRDGRFKKHYLNAVPILQLADRWVDNFRAHDGRALIDLKASLEMKTEQAKARENEPTKGKEKKS